MSETSSVHQELRKALLRYFSEEYVLDPSHTFWKEMWISNDGWITVQQLITFPDILAYAPEGVESVLMVAEQCDGVLFVDRPHKRIKRIIALDESKDPIRRTICVRPIHGNTDDAEIRLFFSVYGAVKNVERHTFTDFDLQRTRNRPWAFVEFEDEASVERCLAAKPTFGTIPNFGRHFIPTLTVSKRKEFEERLATDAETHYQGTKRASLTKNQTAEGEFGMPSDLHAPLLTNGESSANKKNVFRRIPEGSILVIPRLPDGVSWREIKSTLGEIAKGVCSIVYILTDTEGSGATYVFMKTQKGAQMILDRYHAEAGSNSALLEQIPVMNSANKVDEVRAKQFYEQGGNPQVERKRKLNESRRNNKSSEMDSKKFRFVC